MTSKTGFVWVLAVCGCIYRAGAEQPKFSVGLEVDGKQVVQLSYVAQPLESPESIGSLLKGELSRKELDEFNLGTKFSKVATLVTQKDIQLGQIELAAGKYPAGFNADEKGNLFFIVWVDGKAKKTPLEVKSLKEDGPPFLTFLCGPYEDDSALVALFRTHYSVIPVKGLTADEDEDETGDEDWKDVDTGDGFSGK